MKPRVEAVGAAVGEGGTARGYAPLTRFILCASNGAEITITKYTTTEVSNSAELNTRKYTAIET